MLWVTLGNIIHEEFMEWCEKYKASPSPRNMIEYLGAAGYLKMRKMATEFTEKGKVPSLGFDDFMSRRIPLREGFLIPSTVVYPKKKKEKKYEHSD